MAHWSGIWTPIAVGMWRRLLLVCGVLLLPAVTAASLSEDLTAHMTALSTHADRSSGSPGGRAAGAYIRSAFEALELSQVGEMAFSLPVRRFSQCRLVFGSDQDLLALSPFAANAVAPDTLPAEGLSGNLIYVGHGEPADFNGRTVAGSIVLMELESGRNWLNAASLGAKALIYIDRGGAAGTPKSLYEDKYELTPLQFPRFWLPIETVRERFGAFESSQGDLATAVRLRSDMHWTATEARNIYALVPGSDPDLSETLLLVEAFYDSTALVAGRSPGAEEALGAATLLTLARHLKANPPRRSVLLVATDAHAHTLGGMREMIWSVAERSRELRQRDRELKKRISAQKATLKLLEETTGLASTALTAPQAVALKTAVAAEIKNAVDRLSRELMQLRMQTPGSVSQADIAALAEERLLLRRLDWQTELANLDPAQQHHVNDLLPLAEARHRAALADAQRQLDELKMATRFRALVKRHELAAAVSLHLSSHGSGVGAFNQGWLYPLKPIINRVNAYSRIDEVLRAGAAAVQTDQALPPLFKDTLRPSRKHSWQSFFVDHPFLGGEVSSVAGIVGISLATTHDARPHWGTPFDTIDRIDWSFARQQARLIQGLIHHLAAADELQTDEQPRYGFATVTGRANFLRHGELFPDQPAPDSVLLSYQGPGRYISLVDTQGRFQIKGVVDKKHVLHKVIIEGYKFDPRTGKVVWAIDKNQTTKANYRVKMQHPRMETDLVMFACRGTTIFNLLEPRSFRYMTKLNLYDGRQEAPPVRFWYSRIDTRDSVISSIYLEPTTPLKLTLSDSVLRHKLILTNADGSNSQGTGYRLDQWPRIAPTEYRVAKDMWALLAPRIANLERHGIHDDRIAGLQQTGLSALSEAETALAAQAYDRFFESARRSWALASRVYEHVERTQKDVLLGVLFYIALFVPFAFCAERLLFSYRSIYKRISAFMAILLLLITVIYNVHPAFQLAYSPTVVILAFFIIGLSLMVSLIIFLRFEEEMMLLQRQSQQKRAEEVSMWKAFAAAFFLGVSNLRRRRLRTALTCITLVILTFTIMSFTSVNSLRRHTRLQYNAQPAYEGILLKNINWQDLPPEALAMVANKFADGGRIAPRIWLEADDRTRVRRVLLSIGNRTLEAQGVVGLAPEEPAVTGMDAILMAGRWFDPGERDAVLLPQNLAQGLGITPSDTGRKQVNLWGVPYTVVGIFDPAALGGRSDLDGEPLTPVTFPSETAQALTEVEMEALESGDDVRAFQSRYVHVPPELVVILPAQTLLSAGGHLKAIALKPGGGAIPELAERLSDRFGLTLFSGEPEGSFVYTASDTLSYSGVPNILIPVVISILIVLNTMISSVYERKREIGIYTSVGLAPSHVAFLFIAEALAFAVLSVVMGYIVAQTAAKFLAGSALWAGITVNYSSMAGVAAMVLVIVVVLVSVIYPSRVAAAIAIPDVKRSWQLPKVHGNHIEITLPFLLKAGEEKSAAGYIYDYFNGHLDISHGLFSTGDLKLGVTDAPADQIHPSPKTPCLQMESLVWLAPFDLGVVQQVELLFCASADEPGFIEIRMRITRGAGEANAWRRTNKMFIHQLRKQMLVWRSLSAAHKFHYENALTTPLPSEG
ncbi:MAG: peptide ABC transporter permease [Desulfosarcinaceae bacterium]|nr:peptide ABC transporter permease [Desulfosarcinaceae bacterium]